MALAVGIVGLPNVGKSTLLNALTQAGADASNYPFCTIEMNVGVTPVPDPELLRLERILEPEETVPTTIRFVDIAGLVAGASKGDGLGNTFLGHIREVDAILHVVRCFASADIVHATGEPDPVRDVRIVETELMLADLETAARALEKLERRVGTGDKSAVAERDAFGKAVAILDGGTPLRAADLTPEERARLAPARLLTAKPCLYLANTGENDPRGEGPLPTALREDRGEADIVCVSVEIEEEISELSPPEQAEFLEELGLAGDALHLVINASYRLLGLITFYTIANRKLQAWQLPRGATAPEAAGRIHSDMQDGFIRAEVMALEDLLREGSRHALHEKGLIRTVGRDYAVQDRDVLQIHFK
ncbi:redox-regulated ATPase YchF [bacterium]|nr:redox-regulated ATPase YchF [bacterium]